MASPNSFRSMPIDSIYLSMAGLLMLQSAASVWEGYKYLCYLHRQQVYPEFTPRAAIFAPCKGLEEGLTQYLESLFQLDYPDYSVIFIVECADDPAVTHIERLRMCHPERASRLVVAGESVATGQKVHNLLRALAAAEDAEVYVFADSDVTLTSRWLRSLIAPLQDSAVGATTGYRWFIPTGSTASILRSAWNGTIATALGPKKQNFAWGGSMAILRRTFEQARVAEYWQGAVSDDYALTCAISDQKLYIMFVPACVVPSYGETSFRELLEFTSRQILITRVYANHLFRLLLFSTVFFNLVFWPGMLLSVWAAFHGRWWPALATLVIYLLGAWKGYLRVKALDTILSAEAAVMARRYAIWYVLLPPLVSLLYLYNLATSLLSRVIEWRGVTYELLSSRQTRVLRRR